MFEFCQHVRERPLSAVQCVQKHLLLYKNLYYVCCSWHLVFATKVTIVQKIRYIMLNISFLIVSFAYYIPFQYIGIRNKINLIVISHT